MDEVIEKKDKPEIKIWNVILFLLVLYILPKILNIFLASSLAYPLSLIIYFLICYPIFIRGTVNRWSKDKRQWTFTTFMLQVLAIAIIYFGLFKLFGY
ncbi:MAG: hypothetical protein K1X72_25330 [Pyrinomonadaceae bacterium]|nr:hypothetical protein [Pyrinomonadaceae bacterium]